MTVLGNEQMTTIVDIDRMISDLEERNCSIVSNEFYPYTDDRHHHCHVQNTNWLSKNRQYA